MTPKKKTEELVDKFKEHSKQSLDQNTINEFDIRKIEYIGSRFSAMMRFSELYNAKKCALIAVDEIIIQWEYIDTYLSDLGGELNPNLKYWYNVKQEIEKL